MRDRPPQKRASEIVAKLAGAGLRVTRPRLELAILLFAGPDRHVSAEDLSNEAVRLGRRVSHATIYNCLKQFTASGLLKEIVVDGNRSYFDTRIDPHVHYLNEATGVLFDAPDDAVEIEPVAAPPEDLEISEIQVVIRLRPRLA